MNDSSGNRNPVELLAEEFIARKRRGEKPTLAEYADRYPDLAAEIREVFPALLMMEDLAESSLGSTGPHLGAGLTVSQLGDYRVLREVGRGGMGVVFEAEQVSLGRRVALKVLPAHALKDDQQIRRFEREARAAARLHHTNIVPVFGVGCHDGMHFYVMQFIQGLGLDGVLGELRRLRAGKAPPVARPAGPDTDVVRAPVSQVVQVAQSLLTGQFQAEPLSSTTGEGAAPRPKETASASNSSVPRLPEGSDLSSVSGSDMRYWRSVARIGVQVAGALEHAHSQGIFHRDIKPSNLLMDMKGTVWVTDFGLAKAREEDALTETGDVVGTLRYMAPERFRTPGDARSDVYSLGLTLYELLALRPAFNQRDRPQLMQQVLHAEPPKLRNLNRAIPRDLETIVHKAIAKEPRHRYAGAAELAADLQRFLEDRPILARPAGTLEVALKWVKRRPAVAALLALVLMVSLAGLGAFAWQFADTLEEKHHAENEAHLKDVEAGLKTLALGKAEQHAADARQKEQVAHDNETTALKSVDRLKRTLFTAQLVRAGAVAASDPEGALDLLNDPETCPLAMRDFSWAFYYGQSKRDRWVLPAQTSSVDTFAVSADGKTLATHYDPGAVTVWDLATGKVRVRLTGSWADNTFLLLSPDGKVLYTYAGGRNTLGKSGLERWDTAGGQSLGIVYPQGQVKIPPVLSRDGRWLAAMGDEIKVWEVGEAGCKEHAVFKVQRINATNDNVLAISADGRTVALASEKKSEPGVGFTCAVRLWDVAAKEEREPLEITGRVTALVFDQDGKTFYTAGGGGATRWDLATGKQLEYLEPAAAYVDSLTLSANNKILAGGGPSGGVTVWDLQTGKVRTFFRSARTPLALLPDGSALLSRSEEGAVRRWDLDPEAGRPLAEGGSYYDKVARRTVERRFTPDGKYRVLLPTGAALALRDGRTDKPIGTVADLARKCEIQFSPDSKTMVVITEGSVRLCDPRTGREHGTFATLAGDLQFSPDGSYCVAEVGTRTRDDAFRETTWHNYVEGLQVWDVTHGREVALLKGAQGPVVFSSDGKLFAAVAGGPRDPQDTTKPARRPPVGVKVWETATGRERANIDLTEPVAFSPDGTTLLVRESVAPLRPRVPRGGSRAERSVKPSDMVLWDLAAGKARFALEEMDLRNWFPRQSKFSVDESNPSAIISSSMEGAQRHVNVAFSPDGKLVASANAVGNVTLRDTLRGAEAVRLTGHTGSVLSMAFTADGKTLATSGEDRTIRLWEVSTGRELHTLRGTTLAVVGVSFSADDKVLVAQDESASTTLWDVAGGRPYLFRGGPPSCSAAALSPDGKTLATASGHEVHLWDAATGDLLATLEGHTAAVAALTFSGDGATLTSENAIEVKQWNVASHKETTSRRVAALSLLKFLVSPDGKTLVAREEDVITLRDPKTGEQRGRLEGVAGPPVFSPDGNRCLIEVRVPGQLGRSSTVWRLWDLAAARELATFEGAQGGFVFSPDGKSLAGVAQGPALLLWDTATGRERGRLAGGWVPVSVSPTGDTVLVQDRDKNLALWNPGDKAPRRLPDAVLPAAFASDGKTLASCGPQFAVQLWNVVDGKPAATLTGHERAVESLAFAPDGRTLLSTSLDASDRTLKLWDVADRRERASLKVPNPQPYPTTGATVPPVYLPDGKTVVWVAYGKLKRLEVETGKEVPATPDLQAATVFAISPDCRTLVILHGGDGALADAATGRMRVLSGIGGFAGSWWFTSDGKHLVVGLTRATPAVWPMLTTGDGRFHVMDVGTAKEVAAYYLPSARAGVSGYVNTPDHRLQVRQRQTLDVFLTLVDPNTGRQLGSLEEQIERQVGRSSQPVAAALAAFSPDGKVFATVEGIGGDTGAIQLWDSADGTVRERFRARQQSGPIQRLKFSADSQSLFALTAKEIYRCDRATGKIESTSLPIVAWQTAAIRGDGKLVAYAVKEEVRLFDVDAEKTRTLSKAMNVTSLELAPDGRFLAVAGGADDQRGGQVRVYDLESGKELWSAKTPIWMRSALLTFSADGRTLAGYVAPDTIKLWDRDTGKERGTVASKNGAPFALAPDAKSIALNVADGSVTVREIVTGKELRSLPLFLPYTHAAVLQFSPSGNALLMAPINSNQYHCLLWSPASDGLRFFRNRLAAHSLAVSPDGKTLAVGGASASTTPLATPLSVLDAETGREQNLGLWQLGHVVTAYSPDGKWLAYGGDRGPFIRLWDVEKQAVRTLQRGHTGGVVALAFSSDGKFLASSGADQTVRVWNVAEGKETAVFKGLTVNAEYLAFSADGKTVVSATPTRREPSGLKSIPGEVKVWDVATAKERSGFGLGDMPSQLALSRAGAVLASAAPDGTITVWDVLAGKERLTLPKVPTGVVSMAFSPDGKTLVTSSRDAKLRLWDWAAGVEQADYFRADPSYGRAGGVATAVVFSPDGKTLFVAGVFQVKQNQRFYTLWHYDAVTGKDLGPVGTEESFASSPTSRGAILAAALSGDGKTLVTAWHNMVDLWDLTATPGSAVTGQVRRALPLPSGFSLRHLVVRADGKVVATGDYGKGVYLWDAQTGRQLAELKFDNGQFGDLSFSPDGKRLAVAWGKSIRLFDAETGADKGSLDGHRAPVVSLAFRADGGVLLSRTRDGEVKLWDLATGKESRTVLGQPALLPIDGLEPDGKTVRTKEIKTLAGTASSNTFRRWDLATGREVGEPEVVAGDLHFSPDRQVRFAIGFDASIRLVDPATSEEHFRLPLSSRIEEPQFLFSPDGKRVAVVGSESGKPTSGLKRPDPADGPRLVQVWDLPTARLLASFRGIVAEDWVRKGLIGRPWPPLLVFSPDGRYVALVERDAASAANRQLYVGVVRVLDLTTGEPMPVVKVPHFVTSLAFSTDGKVLATGDREAVHLWDVAGGKELRTVATRPRQYVHVLGFAVDDSVLVLDVESPRTIGADIQSESHDLMLWDLATDQARTTLKGARLPVDISPNGRSVAAVGSAGANWTGHIILVWDAFTGQQRAILRGHRGQINKLWFTPDGDALISQSWDGLLRWQAAWPDSTEELYLQGNALLWKMEPKLQNFHGGSDKPYLALVPAAERFCNVLEAKHDHAGAYGSLARVVELLNKVPGEDNAKLRSQVLALLRQMARTCQDRPEAHFLLGTALEAESPKEALEQYRQAVALDARHLEAHARIAALLLQTGQPEEALAAYRQVLKIEPDHPEANRRAGELLLQQGDAAGAVPLLRKLVDVKPDGAGYYLLARALERAGQTDDAIAAYEKAATFPGTNALRDLAQLLERHGRWADAVAVQRRRGAASPRDLQIHLALAYALRRDGQMTNALAAYRRCQELGWRPWIHGAERWTELEKKLPADAAGKVESTDGDELLALSNLALFKARTPTAARLYADALTAKPKLIDGERYNAACAAALAGTDADKEAVSLDEKDKARWRRQALDWLRQELERQRQALKEGLAEGPWQVQERLSYWRYDPDLFGVVDPARQTAWPQEERTAWAKLWADVDELRQRALRLSTGRWRVEGDDLVQPARIKAPCWLRFGDPKWTDYDVEVEALREEGGHDGFGIGVRMADMDNHCLVNLGGWTNRAHGVELTRDGQITATAQAGAIEAGRWYKVRIEVRGDQARVYLDGKYLLAFGTADHPHGGVGLRSWDTVNRFRNLKVTDPQGKVLFQGQPPLPAEEKP